MESEAAQGAKEGRNIIKKPLPNLVLFLFSFVPLDSNIYNRKCPSLKIYLKWTANLFLYIAIF